MTTESRSTWSEGLVAGLLAFASVALFFLVLNLVRGEPPLETVARLGAPLVPGEGGEGDRVAAIFAFNGIHLAASLAVGLFAAWLLHEAELHNNLWYVFFSVFLAAGIFSIVVMGVVGAELLSAVGWGDVAGANALWAGTILVYLLRRHRDLGERLKGADPEA